MEGERLLLSFLLTALTPWQKLSASQVPLGEAGSRVPSHFSGFLLIHSYILNVFTKTVMISVRACDEFLSLCSCYFLQGGDTGRQQRFHALGKGHPGSKQTGEINENEN